MRIKTCLQLKDTYLLNFLFFSWFHGKITREKSEEMMKPKSGGTFLVRESTHFPGDYTLSVQHDHATEHYRILYAKNLLTVDEETYFENLIQLVDVSIIFGCVIFGRT